MRPCFAIRIETPRRYLLDGLWFGPARAGRVVVFVHGLGGSAFEKQGLAGRWVSKDTAVMTFSNRGHDGAARVRRKTKNKKSFRSENAGTAHERFADCLDDIDGTVRFAKRQGAKTVVLAGHSTGCQKIVYYASKKPDGKVKGLILLAPVSDYAGAKKRYGERRLVAIVRRARTIVRKGDAHKLLPASVWNEEPLDAARFLSLYTPESVEEIFTYASGKRPAALRRVKMPILALLAEKDEYADRSANALAAWFAKELPKGNIVRIVPRAKHGFRGGEARVAKLVRAWLARRIARG